MMDSKIRQEDEKTDNDKTENNVLILCGGGKGLKPKTAITDKTYELSKEKLLDKDTKFTYVNLRPNLEKILYSNKKWLETWKNIDLIDFTVLKIEELNI